MLVSGLPRSRSASRPNWLSAAAFSQELELNLLRMRKDFDLLVVRNLPKLIARCGPVPGASGGQWSV